MADQNNPTPEAGKEAKPAAPSPTDGTVQENKPSEAVTQKTEENAPGHESFTSVDRNSLPPELQGTYDNMLRDYKKKTTEVADMRKGSELATEKAKRYDEIAGDEVFVKKYNEHLAGQTQPTPTQAVSDDVSEDEFSQAFESKEKFKSFVQKVAGMNKGSSQDIQNVKAEMFKDKFKAQPGNEDFDKLNVDGLITGYIKFNPPRGEHEWGAVLTAARDYARRVLGKAREEGKAEGLGRVNEKVNNSTEIPASGSSQTYSGSDPKTLTTHEAIEMAKRGIRVPQNW